jgi:hypothetical protein
MSIWRHLEGVQIKALGSAVYIRYKDHVLFKNIWQPLEEAMERETIGWLSKENSEIVLVEHDRTIQDTQLPSGQSRTRNEQSKGKTL